MSENSYKYEVGMYGGCFDPLHRGHLKCIRYAANLCRDLYLVLSWSKTRDRFPHELRRRWLNKVTETYPNITIIEVEDTCSTKEQYGPEEWKKGAESIKRSIGRHIDAVFCGASSQFAPEVAEYADLYPDSNIEVVFRPASGSTSSTGIVSNKMTVELWNNVAKEARPACVKSVLIVGGESVGKSTLVKHLADYFDTNYVEEYGKTKCIECGGADMMLADDAYEVALQHAMNIRNARKESNRILIVDTDVWTTLAYCPSLGENNARAIHNMTPKFDYVVWLDDTGTEFVQDGTREEDREKRKVFNEALLTRVREVYKDTPVVSVPLIGKCKENKVVLHGYLDRLTYICNMLDSAL